MKVTHRSRISRVKHEFGSSDSYANKVMPSLLCTMPALDKLRSSLMGNKKATPPIEPANIVNLLDRDTSPITKALVDLYQMLGQWHVDGGSAWLLLPACGLDDMTDEELMATARRQVLLDQIVSKCDCLL